MALTRDGQRAKWLLDKLDLSNQENWNEWERNFFNSLILQAERKGYDRFTPNQIEKMEDLSCKD